MALGQDGKPAVDQLDVNPIDEQRCFAELNEWAEAGLCEAPAAPSIRGEENQEEESGTHEKKIRIGVPVIVDGVEMDRGFVEETGKVAGPYAGEAEEEEEEGFVAAGESSVNEEAGGEASEGEGGPGEEREEPVLRFGEDVDAVDIGLEGPREEARAVGGPERRGEHGDERGGEEGADDAAGASGCDFFGRGDPAEESHENHREAEDVEDVDAEEVGPGDPFVAKSVFLKAEEKAEAEYFGAAEDGLFEDGVAGNSLFAEAFSDERHGDSG